MTLPPEIFDEVKNHPPVVYVGKSKGFSHKAWYTPLSPCFMEAMEAEVASILAARGAPAGAMQKVCDEEVRIMTDSLGREWVESVLYGFNSEVRETAVEIMEILHTVGVELNSV